MAYNKPARMTREQLAATNFVCSTCGRVGPGTEILQVWNEDPARGATPPKLVTDPAFDGLADFAVEQTRCLCGSVGTPRMIGG